MAFGQYILEMEVLIVTEALRYNMEPSPCPSGQTTIEILQLELHCSDKMHNFEQYDMASGCVRLGKPQLKFFNLNCIVQTKCIILNSTTWQNISEI